jgi:DNA-binding response OmpR family regulator
MEQGGRLQFRAQSTGQIVTQPLRSRRGFELRPGYNHAMKKRILVVDDETDFCELLQFRLAIRDYEVFGAANGTEALNRARSELPDVILLDLMLPDVDGLTLCEILRRLPPTRHTPIIMITAASTETTRAAAKSAGACAFLCKPLDFVELQRQLDAVLASPSCNHHDESPG